VTALAWGNEGPAGLYRPSYGILACDGSHPRTGGQLDETARRLSHSEYAAAKILASEGHDVTALPETPGRGPTPDLGVCRATMEVKTWAPVSERDGRPPSANSVYNKLVQASRQSGQAFLLGEGSGLTEQTARRGLDRYEARRPKDLTPLSRIRIKGDNFDLNVARVPSPDLRPPSPGAEPGHEPRVAERGREPRLAERGREPRVAERGREHGL
jgi:hypothetical protein